MKRLVALVLLLILAFSSGCGFGGGAQEGSSLTPRRIVSMAPSNTEILFAIGAGDRVVGVTEWSNYPEEALELPKVGDAFNINFEAVLALEPDLALGIAGQEEAAARLEEMGVETVIIAPTTIAETEESLIEVGRRLGLEDEARAVVAEMEERKEAVLGRLSGASRPKVAVFLDPNDLWVAGSGTFIDELVQLAGGENLATAEGYFQISEESLVAAEPEIFILTYPGVELLESRPALAKTPAMLEGRVHVVDGDVVSRPGPRLISGLEEIARILHPEAF